MLFLALAAVIWGSSFPIITYALRDISPMLFVVLRFTVAFAVLAPSYRSWTEFRRIFNRDIILISIPNALSFILQFKAQELTTASKTALFLNSSPVFVIIFAAVFLKERFGRSQLGAAALAMTGVVVTSTSLDFSGFSDINLGDVLCLVVGLCWGLFIVFSRDVAKKYGPHELSRGLYFWAAVMTLPLIASEPLRFSPSSIPAILYLAFFATLLAYFLYLKGVQSVSPLATSTIILIEVVVAFLLAYFFLGESFSPVETVGVVMVLAGAMLVVRKPEAVRKKPQRERK